MAFALGPLVLLWGRTEVSDALFTATLAVSLLLAWRTYRAERGPWWPCWVALALAVLTKGPVALVLFPLTLAGFWLLGAEGARLRRRLRPLPGLALTLVLAAPWYALALWREGQPYWESFFGYHNLQRYTRVVNNHQQGWWYFFAVLVLGQPSVHAPAAASLRRILLAARTPLAAPHSLGRFAAAWLMAVLLFFTLSATKLPSYWLVATPAAALLVALALCPAAQAEGGDDRGQSPIGQRRALACSVALLLVISGGFGRRPPLAPADPRSHPSRAAERSWGAAPLSHLGGRSPWLPASAGWMGLPPPHLGADSQSSALLLMVPLVLLPMWQIGDQLRGAPIRDLAAIAVAQRSERESVGDGGPAQTLPALLQPGHRDLRGTLSHAPWSIWRIVCGMRSGRACTPAIAEAAHRSAGDRRDTALQPHWQGWNGQEMARAGPYRLWRLDRRWLEERARQLGAEGNGPNWREPRPERF